MSDEDSDLAPEKAVDGLVDQMTTNVSVHGTQRIVHQINVGVDVETSSQIHPSLLATTEGDAFFTHGCFIAGWK